MLDLKAAVRRPAASCCIAETRRGSNLSGRSGVNFTGLARSERNFKPVLQLLIRFARYGEFQLLFELSVDGTDDDRSILSTDRHRVLAKNVKTASIRVETN